MGRDSHTPRRLPVPTFFCTSGIGSLEYVRRCDARGSHDHSIANPCFPGPPGPSLLPMPRSTSQPHLHSSTKVTPAKVWDRLRADFVSSQEKDHLSEVDRIPKTVYDRTC